MEKIGQIGLLCLIWALGGVLEETERQAFHLFVKDIVAGNHVQELYQLDLLFPYEILEFKDKFLEGSVFEQFLDSKKLVWQSWMQTVHYAPPSKATFSDLVVPTVDSVRNCFFLNLYVEQDSHFLITGPTGTGKTINV